jgi:hypothetical protein
MATKWEINEARARWDEHCKIVQSYTSQTILVDETPAEKEMRIAYLLSHYDKFCEYYFPHYLNKIDPVTGEVKVTRNAPFHNAGAAKLRKNFNYKGVWMWPRGHAKSTHLDVFCPIYLKQQTPRQLNYMVVVGKSEDNARELLSSLQAEFEYNQRIISDFGIQKSTGDWAEGYFITADGCVFNALGRGQSPRGLRYKEQRPDYIIIDDLDDDELCRNPSRVEDLYNWVKEALFGALDVGRGRFIMAGNLISKNSVLQKMTESDGVDVIRVNAVDSQGNPTWADKWTKEEAEAAAAFMGYYAWNKEYMHNPIIAGKIFKQEWIKFKKMPRSLKKYDAVIVYIDPSLKPKTTNDYKAVRMWGKMGKELHYITGWVRQDTVSAMVRYCYDLYEKLRDDADKVQWLMEANFIQDILLDEFTAEGIIRGYQLPISGDKRKKSDKIERITNISPLWERGFVYYNEAEKDTPDMRTGIDQTLALCKGSGAHDDAPDADEGAIWRLQKIGRQSTFTPRFGKRPSPKNKW